MELKQLKQFVAVAETGSFTRGAQRACVSQPALSAAIAKLEAELGAPLLARGPRRIALTAEGAKLLESARRILAECAALEEGLRARDAEPLRVGVISTVSLARLAPLFRQFRAAHPAIALKVLDGAPEEVARRFAAGAIDLALQSAYDGGDGRAAESFDPPLFREPYLLAIPAGHPLAGRKSIALAQLAGETMVARLHCEHRRMFMDVLAERGVRLAAGSRTDQDDRALALVEAGLGLAIVPAHLARPGLALARIADGPLARVVGLRAAAAAPAAARLFQDFAKGADWGAPGRADAA